MQGFSDYFEMSALIDLIKGVPQRDDFHLEGPVDVHTKMVRGELNNAIRLFQKAASNPNSSLSKLGTEFSEADINLLRVAAWLHDIGKASATTIDDIPWKDAGSNYNLSKARSIGHESPQHFNPMAYELLKSPIWRKMADKATFEDKKDLWFLIRNHMEIHKTGLSKRLGNYVGSDGKYYDDRRLKLLLVLILMDRMGRMGQGKQKFEGPEEYFNALEIGAREQAKKYEKQSEPLTKEPVEFLKAVGGRIRLAMEKKPWNDKQKSGYLEKELLKALRLKSDKEGLNLSDDSIAIYVKNYLNSG